MANELVKKDTASSLMNLADAKNYGIDLGEEDLVMPRLTLIQPTSEQEGAGKYFLSGLNKTFDEVDVIFFNNTRGRIMFDPDRSKNMAVCGSLDRVIPDSRFENPLATKCIDCKFSNRNHIEEVLVGKNKEKQYCSETMILKGIIVDLVMPFTFTAKRTALRPVNEFLTGAFFDCRLKNKKLHNFAVKLKAEVPPKAVTKYFVPIIERIGILENSEFEAMIQKYSNYDVGKTFEDGPTATSDEPTPF